MFFVEDSKKLTNLLRDSKIALTHHPVQAPPVWHAPVTSPVYNFAEIACPVENYAFLAFLPRSQRDFIHGKFRKNW